MHCEIDLDYKKQQTRNRSGKSFRGSKLNIIDASKTSPLYVQNDVLMETMTPKRAFTFLANFKYEDPEIMIEEAIKRMKLEKKKNEIKKCQNYLIGVRTINLKWI